MAVATHTVTVQAHQSTWADWVTIILQLVAALGPTVIPIIQLIGGEEGAKPVVTVTPNAPAS